MSAFPKARTDRDVISNVSRSTRLLVGILFGTLALEVTVLRLLEFSFLRTYLEVSLREVVWRNLPFVFALALILGLGYVLLGTGRMKDRIDGRLRMTVVAAGVAVVTVGATYLIPAQWFIAHWLSLRAFAWVRWDLLIVLVLAAAFALLLEFSRGWRRAVVLAAMHIVVVMLMVLMAASFVYMLGIGVPGGWYEFKIFVLSFGELLPVVASEATAGRMALLVLPIAVLALPHLLMKGLSLHDEKKGWTSNEGVASGRRVAVTLRVATVVLPLAALLCLPPGRWLPFQQSQSFYGGLVATGASDMLSSPIPAATAASLDDMAQTTSVQAPGFFDTDSLQLAPTSSPQQGEKEPKNVVFILLESTRRRSTTPYDSTLQTTPFLDSLAQRSLLVKDMTAVVPYTTKAMVPIFAGVYSRPVAKMVETEPGGLPAQGLPALLHKKGYATAFFSSATTDFENKVGLLHNLGFSHVAGYHTLPTKGFKKVNYFGYEGRIVTNPSMQWVDSVRSQGKPFFTAYLNASTHHPYDTPPSFNKEKLAKDKRLNDYLNALRYTDGWVRDLFSEYEKRGLIDSTLFVILGDHGEAFGEHGTVTHGHIVWNEALEIPALIYNPDLIPESDTIEGPRQQIDLLPTVAQMLGYKLVGGTYPGYSLLKPPRPKRSLYYATRTAATRLAMRRGDLKFIYNYDRQPMYAFNLRNDPFERNDIVSDFSDTQLRNVKRQMLRWRRQVDQVYEQHEAEH